MVTADAMFTHADMAQRVLDSGGDYVLSAKGATSGSCTRTSRPPSPPPNPAAVPPAVQAGWTADVRTATTRSKGHGRTERRAITTTTWLGEYLSGWPGVAQVFRLVRERTVAGVTAVEVGYGITSLGRVVGDAGRLLELSRRHWGIENELHDTRDETFREDRCRVRRGNAPRVMTSLRNIAVHLLRNAAHPSVPAATREMVAFPSRALDLLKALPSTSDTKSG